MYSGMPSAIKRAERRQGLLNGGEERSELQRDTRHSRRGVRARKRATSQDAATRKLPHLVELYAIGMVHHFHNSNFVLHILRSHPRQAALQQGENRMSDAHVQRPASTVVQCAGMARGQDHAVCSTQDARRSHGDQERHRLHHTTCYTLVPPPATCEDKQRSTRSDPGCSVPARSPQPAEYAHTGNLWLPYPNNNLQHVASAHALLFQNILVKDLHGKVLPGLGVLYQLYLLDTITRISDTTHPVVTNCRLKLLFHLQTQAPLPPLPTLPLASKCTCTHTHEGRMGRV